MSNIGFTCDVCGRTVQGITYVNGMKFCAKCYQETFGKPEVVVSWAKDNPFEKLKQENKTKDERIAELERQIREQIMGENEAAKETIANILGQKKTTENRLRHEICDKIRLYCRDRFEPVPDKLGCIAEINREEFFEFLDEIEQGDE